MRNNLHFLYPFRGIELTLPPDSSPDDAFQPILITHNTLQEAGIRAQDVLYAQLNADPAEGRFSYVETSQVFLLGFVFKKPGGAVKVESLCRAPCCPPVRFAPPDLVVAAPVVRLLRHHNGVTSKFVFDERRPELWET